MLPWRMIPATTPFDRKARWRLRGLTNNGTASGVSEWPGLRLSPPAVRTRVTSGLIMDVGALLLPYFIGAHL